MSGHCGQPTPAHTSVCCTSRRPSAARHTFCGQAISPKCSSRCNCHGVNNPLDVACRLLQQCFVAGGRPRRARRRCARRGCTRWRLSRSSPARTSGGARSSTRSGSGARGGGRAARGPRPASWRARSPRAASRARRPRTPSSPSPPTRCRCPPGRSTCPAVRRLPARERPRARGAPRAGPGAQAVLAMAGTPLWRARRPHLSVQRRVWAARAPALTPLSPRRALGPLQWPSGCWPWGCFGSTQRCLATSGGRASRGACCRRWARR
jgi:hypothetical protein